MSDPRNKSKNMSVEDILAACRQQDGATKAPQDSAEVSASGSDAAAAEVGPEGGRAADSAVEADSVAGQVPREVTGKKAREMSVAQMLAAARAEKSASQPKTASAQTEEPAAAPKPATKAKPLARASSKPAAEVTKPAAVSQRAGPTDTASILAAARKQSKKGPMSKAEAATKERSLPAGHGEKKKLPVPPMPEKPFYARATPPAPQEDRRTFFASLAGVFLGSALAVGFSSLALTHVLWALGLARFMFPNILTEPPSKFKVGFPTDYGPGQVETKFKAQFGVWIVRYEYEGVSQIFALQTVCTHLGCTPNWLEGEQKFKCPCHGSGFYKDGINFEGPAPRPLERFAISLADDGQLEVDKSRRFLEEKGEWTDTASFVPV